MTSRTTGRGAALLICLAAIAVITLLPRGTGWAWADPSTEIAWYLRDTWGATTFVQWFGNVVLLPVPTALATACWSGRARLVVGGGAATAVALESLQALLSLGRVVSVADTGLNLLGALLTAVAVQGVRWQHARGQPSPSSDRRRGQARGASPTDRTESSTGGPTATAL